MKPTFKVGNDPSNRQLKEAAQEFAGQFGESAVSGLLGKKTIGMTTTRIAHGWKGGVPRWRLYDQESAGTVYQTQPADREFLYLAATSTVITGVEVF